MTAPSELVGRIRRAPVERLTLVLAALAFAGMVIEVLTSTWTSPGTRPADIVVAAIVAGCVAGCVRRPDVAAIVAGIVLPASTALGADIADGSGVLALIALVLVFALAVQTDSREFWPPFAVFAIGVQIMALLSSNDDPVATFVWLSVVLLGFPAVAGRVIRWRAEANAELASQADELERNREARAHAAGLAERRRIATELHDVVAHDVAVMLVQAQAAARLITAGRPEAAGSIEEIENTGREALAEMRRILGVLRRGDDAAALVPQPSLARAGEMAAQACAQGFDVTVTVHGDPVPLPSGLDLTAYRIVQEALNSVTEHGGATRANACFTYAPDTVTIELSADGELTAACLEGIRERARMYGGRTSAELDAQGHGRLRVTLPLDPVGAAA